MASLFSVVHTVLGFPRFCVRAYRKVEGQRVSCLPCGELWTLLELAGSAKSTAFGDCVPQECGILKIRLLCPSLSYLKRIALLLFATVLNQIVVFPGQLIRSWQLLRISAKSCWWPMILLRKTLQQRKRNRAASVPTNL